MNPKTKLNDDEIRRICHRHGIKYKSHERITTGFSHEVHRLNDDLVIKLFNKETKKNYFVEKSILFGNFPAIKKPQFVAGYDRLDSFDSERAYIIMSYLDGVSLGKVWHKVSDGNREKLIEEISSTLKAFQAIPAESLAIDSHDNWVEYLWNKVNKLIYRLKQKDIISAGRETDVISAFQKAIRYFAEDEPLQTIYWDIHFDNFIVDKDYNLLGIIDLENVRRLPIDYPLFVIRRQMKEPHKYLAEEDEKYAKKEDYQNLWGWYQRYYPEMFTPKNLEERILTYQLLDELHLMIDWSHDAELRESFEDKIEKFHNL
ncbi:phosphotransferase [Candidatus Nomurabacteria bacterium]|jgi:hypothetical protein|nr:phosphotransferase [Candidatus Saccharibacteria bacterium]MCB9822216.1 phosphotransferase [Candidatus Nomurabacteria bacterium]MDQ5969858.1 hypothetical protein [Patescibacteria group bacterium]